MDLIVFLVIGLFIGHHVADAIDSFKEKDWGLFALAIGLIFCGLFAFAVMESKYV